MLERDTDYRNHAQAPVAVSAIYRLARLPQSRPVLRTADILRLLEEKGIPRTEIADTIKIGKSRVTELYKGERTLKLEEAATLVEKYDLESESGQQVQPLPASIYRLACQYVAQELGVAPPPGLLDELALDMRAFVAHVRDPKVRGSIEAAEAFFRAMQLRRPDQPTEVPQEKRSRSAA